MRSRYGDFATVDKTLFGDSKFPVRFGFPRIAGMLSTGCPGSPGLLGEILKSSALLAAALLCASPAAAATAAGDYTPFASLPPVDPAAIATVDTGFTPTADDEKGFEKYFFFHRDGTDFATAYSDLNECDSFARALGPSQTYDPTNSVVWAMQQQMVAQYGMAGAAGGAIGGLIGGIVAAEVAASAQRNMRRKTMLTCMGFKEYQAYGAPKPLWQTFNSDSAALKEDLRVRYLQLQAKLASGPKPSVGKIQ
jgi:hypothetical protein